MTMCTSRVYCGGWNRRGKEEGFSSWWRFWGPMPSGVSVELQTNAYTKSAMSKLSSWFMISWMSSRLVCGTYTITTTNVRSLIISWVSHLYEIRFLQQLETLDGPIRTSSLGRRNHGRLPFRLHQAVVWTWYASKDHQWKQCWQHYRQFYMHQVLCWNRRCYLILIKVLELWNWNQLQSF